VTARDLVFLHGHLRCRAPWQENQNNKKGERSWHDSHRR